MWTCEFLCISRGHFSLTPFTVEEQIFKTNSADGQNSAAAFAANSTGKVVAAKWALAKLAKSVGNLLDYQKYLEKDCVESVFIK